MGTGTFNMLDLEERFRKRRGPCLVSLDFKVDQDTLEGSGLGDRRLGLKMMFEHLVRTPLQ